jgi:hypothetical protein
VCESPARHSGHPNPHIGQVGFFFLSRLPCCLPLLPGFPLFAEAMPLTRRPQFCVTFALSPFIYIAPSGTWANPGLSTSLCAAFFLFAFFVPHFHIINFLGLRLICVKYSKNTRNILYKDAKQNLQNTK